MTKEKTSVLMSVYYKENPAFFDLSLSSIFCNQTKKPDEFILVCDGQLNDELEKVILKFSNLFPNVFKVLRIEQNQGLGKSLNFGLKNCSNSLIIRADSDDVCVPNRIEILTDYLSNHPEISIVSSYIDEFDKDYNNPINIKTMPLKHDELVSMAKVRNPINHMAVAFRKEAILDVGSYRHIPYVEDYDLWLRCIVKGYKLANIDKVLVHARIGNGMVKRRGNKQYISSWRVINRFMLDEGMINRKEYHKNMLYVRVFVLVPSFARQLIYKKFLRNSKKGTKYDCNEN